MALRFHKPKEQIVKSPKGGFSVSEDDVNIARLSSQPFRVKNVRLYLRKNRNVHAPGFGSITLDLHGFTAMVSSITILRDEDGTFHARLPFSESPNKKVGAERVTCDECGSSYIPMPNGADEADLSKPWLSRWPTVGGDLGDACSRCMSGLVMLCDTCEKMTPHDPQKLRDLENAMNELMGNPDISFDDINDIRTEISKTLEVCSLFNKSIMLNSEGTIDCSGYYPAIKINDYNASMAIDNAYDASNDDGSDIIVM